MPFFEHGSCSIYYRWDNREGDSIPDRPVLLLSHSLGSHLGMWEPQIETLSKQFRLLRYDHPGHGRSEFRPGPLNISDFGEDALALLDHLELEQVNFCGLSLGGMTGMWLGSHAPHRFHNIVLSSTTAFIEDTSLLRDRIALIRRDGLTSIVDSVMSGWLTESFRSQFPARVQWATELLLETKSEAYADTAEMVCNLDLRSEIAGIPRPVLVISGDQDCATPPAWNRDVQANIPHAQWCSLSAAHLANVEAVDDFNSCVLNFFTPSDPTH